MDMNAMIHAYLEYGMSKQLRERTLVSYEQALKLFDVWLREEMEIDDVEEIRDITIRKYILDLQTRGKYTACVEEASILSLQSRGKYTPCAEKQKEETNCPSHRTGYGKPLTNLTINGYLRNIRGFFAWMAEEE